MSEVDTSPRRLSQEQRADVLGSAIHRAALAGWRVSSQTSTQAQLAKGKRVNHLLHLILTLVTLGFWAIVWIIVAATGGEQHQFVSVDEYGNVSPAFFAVAKAVRPVLSTEARSSQLAQAVATLGSQGWTVIAETETTAELKKRNWLWPWRPHRHRISIDEYGQLRYG